MTRKQTLLQACPRGDQVADIPAAFQTFVDTLDTEMASHSTSISREVDTKNQQLRTQVEVMTRNLRYDQIMADATARAYTIAWLTA